MTVNGKIEQYAEQLVTSMALREAALRAAVRTLEPAAGSRGLDVGCGAGLQCLMLAEAVGPAGQVTGADVVPEFLELGRGFAVEAGLAERVTLQEGDANQLPFADDTFDWAWSVDCIGYGPWDPTTPLREMTRVVRPGGRVAILAWSSEKLLPGYPALEARLQATTAGLSPFQDGMPPARHLPRALGLLRAAGLTDLRAHTLAGAAHAPLSAEVRAGLASLFAMRWPEVESELEAEDLAAFERLCRPESPDFILDHEDYYALFTYSMFLGRVG